jgi:sulfopyruvate decarboxylase TPP-binding subunit
MFYTGQEIVSIFVDLGVTDVIWVPDSALGAWEPSLEDSSDLRLLRVCREGEAWPLAAGLYLGGRTPILVMQSTGLYESGDALRNVLYDLQLPLFAVIGARSWLAKESKDSAKRFAARILEAWQLQWVLVADQADKPKLAEHYRRCRQEARPGVALIAEGRM